MARPTSAVVSDGTGMDTPISTLVTPAKAKHFARLSITTVGDLLHHYPFRYVAPGEVSDQSALRDGMFVSLVALVASSQVFPVRNPRKGGPRGRLVVTITDGKATMELVFFHRSMRALEYQQDQLQRTSRAIFMGKVSTYRGATQLVNPSFEPIDIDASDDDVAQRASSPIPIYRATAKLPSMAISRQIRQVFDSHIVTESDVPEPLPESYRDEHGLTGAWKALRTIHLPASEADWQAAHIRGRHEEAVVLQAALARRREAAATSPARPCSPVENKVRDAFDARLPFELTSGQHAVGQTLEAELASEVPMQRLLQGDVGSGKTLVALRAMLQVVDSGGQAVLLAPTEVLASQHFRTLTDLMGPLAMGGMLGAAVGGVEGTDVVLLTGSLPQATKRRVLADMASGRAGIIVATHAVLTDTVQIPWLALTVVDEQHRFGVEQRDALRHRGETQVHQLVMTATPIPRTVAMTAFGDLEISSLRELPAGRQPITTYLVPGSNSGWMRRVWELAREHIDDGGRVFVICSRISDDDAASNHDAPPAEPSDSAKGEAITQDVDDLDIADSQRPPLATVDTISERLAGLPQLDGVALGQVHGKMSAEDKDRAMDAFNSGQTPLIVATTVVEVGVDVPEATLMIILDGDRFGLSQLHQLRGRIGRGNRPGTCLAVHHAADGDIAHQRLTAFAATTDGFALADTDLELRREGTILGAQQSGRRSSLRLLRLGRDRAIIETARAFAKDLVGADSSLEGYPDLRVAIATALTRDAEEFLDRG